MNLKLFNNLLFTKLHSLRWQMTIASRSEKNNWNIS